MVRLKKDGTGGYINRDTGEPVSAEIWKPIIEKARSDGRAAHVSRPKAPPKPRAIVPKKDAVKMVRLKKDGTGGYINRDTGEPVSAEIWKPIIEKARSDGRAAHVSRPKAPPKPRAIVPKKDGSGGYVDRTTGRQLNAAEYMPVISRQRAFGNIGANKKNIQQSIKTIQEDYGISEAEAKERYARFVAACDRYGKDSKGRYKADFGKYMYGEAET